MSMTLSQREKNIFYLTAAILAFALLFNFLAVPFLDKADRIHRQIRLARVKLIKYTALVSKKAYIQARYAKFFPGAQLAGSQDGTSVSALTELENLTRDSGIRILDLRPRQAAAAASGYNELPIDLRTEGEIEGYFKFIYNLQSSPSLLKVKSFQLSALPNSNALEGNFSIYQISVSGK